MKSKLIAVIALALVAMTTPGLVRGGAPPIAELLPKDSLGYLELPDMNVFYYVAGEIGSSVVQSLDEEPNVPDHIKVKAKAVLEAFNEVKPLLPKSASLGVLSIDPREGKPSLVLTCELSEDLSRLVSAFGKLMAAAPEIKYTKTEHGAEVILPHGGMPPIGYAVKENVLYLTMGEGVLDRVLSIEPSQTLAQAAHFKEVAAVTGKNAIVSGYINVDAVREIVLPNVRGEARKFAEVLGLKELHGAGISLSADEKLVGFNFALRFTENAPGIVSLFSVPNTAPKGIAYIPDDFSYVARFSLGPPEEFMKKVRALLETAGLGGKIDESIAQIKEKSGLDVNKVLASLGGEVTVGVKIPETLEIPIRESHIPVVLCLEAKDPAYLTETLKSLLSGETAPATITETEVDGKKVMLITPKGEVPVTPALAVDNDMIIMGLSSAAVQKALAAKESGQNISSKPKFKAAMEGLPAGSNVGLEYIETEGLGRLAIAALRLAAAKAPIPDTAAVDRAMECLNRAVQNLEEASEVVYRTPGGLVLQSRFGTRSLMQVLTNGAAFGVKAVMMRSVAREVSVEEQAPEPEEVKEEGKVFIDLDPYVTKSMKNPHSSSPEGNDLTLEAGKQQVGDCIYLIGKGIVQLSGSNLQDAPTEVKGVKAGLKFNKLHILHATGWGGDVRDGTEIGGYTIHYEDGSAVTIPIKCGVHVRDWWASGDSRVSEGKVAWTGKNQQSNIRLYSMSWENPSPDKVVTAVDYRSAGTACAPFLVAMTAEVE